MEVKKQYNGYDWALSTLIAMQIFGGYGGALEPIRVVILLTVPFALIYLNKKKLFSICRVESRYFSLFLIYALISVLFVKDQIDAVKALSYLVVNFSSFFVLLYFAARALNPKKAIINGWLTLFILTIPIALVEIFFDQHLSISVFQSDEVIGGIGQARRSASVTFGNYNAYNVVLVYIFPFLTAALLIRTKFISQLFLWIVILVLFFIVVTNASRGSLICIVVTLGIFLFYYLKSKARGKYTFVILLFSSFAVLVITYFDAFFFLISYRFSSLGVEDSTRTEIIFDSLALLANSFLLGVGTGNFQAAMSDNYNLPIVAPHNFFLEIAVQYGILFFIGFIILLYKLYKKAQKEENMSYKYIVYVSLLIYPIASIINSGYISGISIWMQFGALFIIADPRFSPNKKPN